MTVDVSRPVEATADGWCAGCDHPISVGQLVAEITVHGLTPASAHAGACVPEAAQRISRDASEVTG